MNKNTKSTIMKRKLISSGAKWENSVGYSRAVRVGNHIEVAGTTAVENDEIIGKGDAYLQTKFIIQKIEKALNAADAKLEHVTRTRIFVTDISMWEEIGRAHGEFFKDIKPASTMLEIQALVNPEMLVEVEATAIVE